MAKPLAFAIPQAAAAAAVLFASPAAENGQRPHSGDHGQDGNGGGVLVYRLRQRSKQAH